MDGQRLHAGLDPSGVRAALGTSIYSVTDVNECGGSASEVNVQQVVADVIPASWRFA